MNIRTETDHLYQLIHILPHPLQQALARLEGASLLEVVLDLGRPPQARLVTGVETLADQPVSREDLERVTAAVGEFGADNRAGIEGTLHRVSALRNRRGQVVGLTLRAGRTVFGTIDLIRDLVEGG
ncbi:MAG: single-stranded DNA-binding protein, partial [Candidatus Competibacteraceae bacterium]|nr:single-stranded DNA-binding protein [Candidatus Competibacteraceae bacterium]